MEEKTTGTAAQEGGAKTPKKQGESKSKKGKEPHPKKHKATIVWEFANCLAISANALYYLTAKERNDYFRENTLESSARRAIDNFVINNISYYKLADKANIFGGMVAINIAYYDDLFADKLEFEVRFIDKNENGEYVEKTKSFIYDCSPDAEVTEEEHAFYISEFTHRHGEKPLLIKIVNGMSVLGLLQSSDMYKKSFAKVKTAYASLSASEKELVRGRLGKIRGRLLEASENIIRKGATIRGADREWFVCISDYVKKCTKLVEAKPSLEEAESAKYRTLALYLYMKAKNAKPEDDFRNKEVFYDYMATVIGTTKNAAKEYILSLGQPGLDFHVAKRFENIKSRLKAVFANAIPDIKASVEKQIDDIRPPKLKS